jgi:hypothetical protein
MAGAFIAGHIREPITVAEPTRQDLEQLIFGGSDNRRFTQDSPILPEVWIKYALHPS